MWWSDAAPACRPPRRAALRRLAVAALAPVAVVGCGFQLRHAPRLTFDSIALQGFAPHSTMALALRRALALQALAPIEDTARAAVVLHALDDTVERSAVATTSAAQVREMQVRVKLVVRATTRDGRELLPRTELAAARETSWRETAALAKSYEEAELVRDMQDDLVAQLLRRLAALRP